MSHMNNTDCQTFSFLVDPRRRQKSKNEFFYIIPTNDILEYQPQIILTGSSGNEYRISFTIDSISCTCPDFKSSSYAYPQKLCKHILFILQQIKFDISYGVHHFRPDQILTNLERYSLSNHYIDNTTARLCKSHHRSKCFLCNHYLHNTILTCPLCAVPFHPNCIQQENICPSCRTKTQYISSFLCGSYRNLSNILTYGGYTLSKTLAHNLTNNSNAKRKSTETSPNTTQHIIKNKPRIESVTTNFNQETQLIYFI